MMSHLTYADRELLLETFDSLKSVTTRTDEQLLMDVGEWAKQIVPNFSFELAITRDVTFLSRYLMDYKEEEDISSIARGALSYVLLQNQPKLTNIISDLSLLDDAFLCSYAVYEIRNRLGEPATHNPPKLTPDEMRQAQDMLLGFIEAPLMSDIELVARSKVIREELGNLASSGLFRRLQNNIAFLMSILANPDRSEEHRNYARAALSYLVCEEDIIDDRLGLIGYIDDNFIVQLAVDIIEPNREPLLEFLDEIVGTWPFLNAMVIEDNAGGHPFSEFMIVNSALTCDGLRGDGSPSSTLLITPHVGPMPFLLGLTSAMGLIYDVGRPDLTEESFSLGQKVLVDQGTVAEFTGFQDMYGRRVFGLKKYPTRRGYKEPITHYWPVSELWRLVPVDQSRAIRGQITFDLDSKDMPIPALDYLFNETSITQVFDTEKRVSVVMPVGAAYEMAKQWNLYGHQLKDVIPMGHLTSEGHFKPWSNRFGEQEPVLVFISDLDIACTHIENKPDQNHKVIVDARGRNIGKDASLHRLQSLGIPTLVICEERVADQMNLTKEDQVAVWEWNSNDFSALVWPLRPSESRFSLISEHERRLESNTCYMPEIRNISLPLTEQAYAAVRQVQILASQREDRPIELDEIVTLSFGTLLRLFRSAIPLSGDIPATREIETELMDLKEIQHRSIYLSENEQKATTTAEESLRELLFQLQHSNPKADALYDILDKQPDLVIVCPHALLCHNYKDAYSNFGTRVLRVCTCDEDVPRGAVIPGWFSKERMSALLMPPATKPLHLILYDIEQRWHESFQRWRHKCRQTRIACSNRVELFPQIKQWRTPKLEWPSPITSDPDPTQQELDSLNEHVRTTYRNRAQTAVKSDIVEAEVPARLIIFEGNSYAFLTESYRANVVTHLLDASAVSMEDEADVTTKFVEQLRAGDALLFHRGSDRDVIRTAADGLLAPGIRATSSLWRTALINYVVRKNLTSEQIWSQLRNAGCPLIHQTIKSWLDNENIIGPQAYKRDVNLISKVTGDEALAKHIEEVLAAIIEVRSAHLRASHQLAKKVLARAVHILKEEVKESRVIEIESNVVVARIVEIDDQQTTVRLSLTNRLLEGVRWHE